MNDIEERLVRLEFILKRFCSKNPELCPHDWEWSYSKGSVEYYKCPLCGKTASIEKSKMKEEDLP